MAPGTRWPLIALAVTYLVLVAFAARFYGAGLFGGALTAFEMLAMLALAAGVAWATGRKR